MLRKQRPRSPSVIMFSFQVSPRSFTSGFFLTLRYRALEQREPHYTYSFFKQTCACDLAVSSSDCAVLSKKITQVWNPLCFCLQPISNADFIVPVEIDGTVHQVLLYETHMKIPEVGLNKMTYLFIYMLFSNTSQLHQSGLLLHSSFSDFILFVLDYYYGVLARCKDRWAVTWLCHRVNNCHKACRRCCWELRGDASLSGNVCVRETELTTNKKKQRPYSYLHGALFVPTVCLCWRFLFYILFEAQAATL